MSVSTDSLDVTEVAEHSLLPVPDSARTSTAAHQFWIWTGANIAPINWVLGALGIQLGLSLWQTIGVLVAGNVLGMAVFGFFVLMGQRTGVSQMVLSRSAYGRRGAYLPAAMQGLLSAGWCAVNTWIVLDLVVALFGKVGIHGGTRPEDHHRRRGHGHPGGHRRDRLPGHRPLRALDGAGDPRGPAGDDGGRVDPHRRRLGLPGRRAARRGPVERDEHDHDRDRHRLGHHVVRLRLRLLAVRAQGHAAAQALPRQRPGPVPADRVAGHLRRDAGHGLPDGRPGRAGRAVLRRAGHPGDPAGHPRPDRHERAQHLLLLAVRADAGLERRPPPAVVRRRRRSPSSSPST